MFVRMKEILARKLRFKFSNRVSVDEITIDTSKPLPKHLIIKGADCLLYQIGLSFFNYGSEKRHIFYNPKLIFFVIITNLMRCLIMLLMSKNPESVSAQVHFYILDADYFIGAHGFVNFVCVIVSLLIISLQLLNYYNFKNGIKPTDWRLFQVMSGSLTPDSIGLTDETQITNLIKKFKYFLKMLKFNLQIITWSTSVIIYLRYPRWITTLEWIFILLPNGIHWMMWINYVYSTYLYQYLYFVFITEYLKMKLKQVNFKLSERINYYRGRQESKIRTITITLVLKKLNSISDEVTEYNKIYWSKFILIIWLTMLIVISSLSFAVIFVIRNVILNIILANLEIVNIISILLLIGFSSRIYSEFKFTYKLLNSSMHIRIPLVKRMKVIRAK